MPSESQQSVPDSVLETILNDALTSAQRRVDYLDQASKELEAACNMLNVSPSSTTPIIDRMQLSMTVCEQQQNKLFQMLTELGNRTTTEKPEAP